MADGTAFPALGRAIRARRQGMDTRAFGALAPSRLFFLKNVGMSRSLSMIRPL